jgi:biopolymer transport protein ExbD
MRLKRKDQTVDHIDISPLIDMVFILLIFFMVTMTGRAPRHHHL